MITNREMKALTNEQLGHILVGFDKRKERNSRYVNRYSFSAHQPYMDEYQRRLIAGTAKGHYSEYDRAAK